VRFIYLSVYLFIYLFIYLCMYLFIYYVLCAALPLRDESVDAVVCDLPFGRKFQVGDAAALARLYRAFAAEALRVLSPLGRYPAPLPIPSWPSPKC
jgi:tRNA G10  N-methylase Trm11